MHIEIWCLKHQPLLMGVGCRDPGESFLRVAGKLTDRGKPSFLGKRKEWYCLTMSLSQIEIVPCSLSAYMPLAMSMKLVSYTRKTLLKLLVKFSRTYSSAN